MAKSLRAKNITRILTTGDSTARQLQLNMVKLFFPVWGCRTIKQSGDNETDRLDYFHVPTIPREILQAQLCKGLICRNWFMECYSVENNRTVNFEYIAMPRVIDIGLIIKKHPLNEHLQDASNKLEYLLKYYFPYHGFPDVWLYKTPLRHESWWSSEQEMAADLSYALQLLNLYVPKTTRLVFLSDSRECVHRFPVELRLKYKKEWNSPRNWKIHQHNQVFYHVLSEINRSVFSDINNYTFRYANNTSEHVLKPDRSSMGGSSNMYAFMDDMKLTCPMVCEFHEDAGHYKNAYYQTLNKYILESIFAD
jgi:hypothetical protein